MKITTLCSNGGTYSLTKLATYEIQNEHVLCQILHFGSTTLPHLMSLLHHACVLELVLEEEQIVCGRHCNNIFRRVPRCMQNLFIEIKTVHTNLILLAFPSCTYLHKIMVIKQTFLKREGCGQTYFNDICSSNLVYRKNLISLLINI